MDSQTELVDNPPQGKLTTAQRVALAIAAASAVAAPIATHWEGFSGKAYYDPSHILTQCYGETQDIDPSLIYSKSECATKLRTRLARDYAPVLAACMPVVVGVDWPKYTNVYGALLDASYNAGPQRACNRFAPVVNSGNLRAACKALPSWMVTSKNRTTGIRKTYPGLVNRRKDEARTCIKGL